MMNEELILFWLPIIVAIVAALPGIFAYANERNRLKEERDATALEAWRAMLDPLREQVADLSRIVDEQSEQIREKAHRIDMLEQQIVALKRDLDTAQRLVTAYLGQLLDNDIEPNPVYIEQTKRLRDVPADSE